MRKRLVLLASLVLFVSTILAASPVMAPTAQAADRPAPSPNGVYTFHGTITDPQAAGTKSPNVAANCAFTGSFYKRDAHTATEWSYISCPVVEPYMTQQDMGDHCTLYVLNECITWDRGVWGNGLNGGAVNVCYGAGIDGQFCPSTGLFVWNNVPSGWLVRGDVPYCVTFVDGNTNCGTFFSGPVQF